MVLTEDEVSKLIASARSVREQAYAPYSEYRVGAAVLSTDGRIFVGANVENAAYATCLCAEHNALGTAISAGARALKAVAVCTNPKVGETPGAPCGNCRQALSEFGLDVEVILVGPTGGHETITLREILPRAFTSASL